MGRKTKEELKKKYIGITCVSNQGCEMTIIDYIKYTDIIVEFHDEYKTRKHCTINAFYKGEVKNPMHPTLYGVGMVGDKYPTTKNGKQLKEYTLWCDMLCRCYKETFHNNNTKYTSYKNCIVCDEWLYYPSFYEWLHSQENFNKWLNNKKWTLDKDILSKNNNTYCPEKCCLVPMHVNNLFIKEKARRGECYIGVCFHKTKKEYRASYKNPYTKKTKNIGGYSNPEEAFYAYKKEKEKLIKQIALEEYDKENIVKECYEAMMKYQVEMTD